MTSTARWADLLLIMILGLAIFSYRVGEGPLTGTEGHRVITADQMLHSGEWIVPRLFDQIYLRKPPLHYWILAIVERVTGYANTWVWRLPSAFTGALAGVFFYWISARWFGRIGGLAAGIGYCGSIVFWAENRVAELDSINNLACLIAACLFLDMNWGRKRQSVGVIISAGIAFGAGLLTKGPAGAAPIFAAIIGPAIFDRSLKELKRPGIWLSILLGATLFGIYCFVAWRWFVSNHIHPDSSGIGEVKTNLLIDRGRLSQILILPLTLLLYGIPGTIAAIFVLHPSVWKPSEKWTMSDALLVRALFGTLIVSLVLTMCYGLSNPRYSYVWLELDCPLIGAIAAVWHRWGWKQMPQGPHVNSLKITIASIGIAYCVATMVFAILCISGRVNQIWLQWLTVAASAVICVKTIYFLHMNRFSQMGRCLIVLIILAAIPFAAFGVVQHEARSDVIPGQNLAAMLPPDPFITTGSTVFDFPAMFYYAHIQHVESHPKEFIYGMTLPTSRWVVLEDWEYENWMARHPHVLRDVRNIAAPGNSARYLAWYVAPGDSTQPATAP